MWRVGDLFLLDSGDSESDHTSDAKERKDGHSLVDTLTFIFFLS